MTPPCGVPFRLALPPQTVFLYLIFLFDYRGFKPLLDEGRYSPIDNALGHHGYQFGVRDAVKVFRQASVNDMGVTRPECIGNLIQVIMRRYPGRESRG